MAMSANEALCRRWFDEVWNQGREATVDELFKADGIGHGLSEGDTDVVGPAEFKVFQRNLRSALPDIQISVEDVVNEGEKIAARIVARGTHLGDGLGFPATGRKVSVGAIALLRIVNGQIAEAWNSWDQLGLLRQVGALPVADGQDRFLAKRA